MEMWMIFIFFFITFYIFTILCNKYAQGETLPRAYLFQGLILLDSPYPLHK